MWSLFSAKPLIMSFTIKGQCHEIFCFWFFSWISFPPAPEYSIKTVLNFYENSRIYLQLKVCLFQVSAAWFCSHYLPEVSLIQVAICHRRHWHRQQICRQYHWQHKGNWWQNLLPVFLIPVANWPPVSLIPKAICHRCRWHRWCTLTCEYLREFSKKF